MNEELKKRIEANKLKIKIEQELKDKDLSEEETPKETEPITFKTQENIKPKIRLSVKPEYPIISFRPNTETSLLLKQVPHSKRSKIINVAIKDYFNKQNALGFLW